MSLIRKLMVEVSLLGRIIVEFFLHCECIWKTPNNWNLLRALSSLETNHLAEESDVPNVDGPAGKRILNIVGVLSCPVFHLRPVHHMCCVKSWEAEFRIQHTVWAWIRWVLAFTENLYITSAGMRRDRNINITVAVDFSTATSRILEKLHFWRWILFLKNTCALKTFSFGYKWKISAPKATKLLS